MKLFALTLLLLCAQSFAADYLVQLPPGCTVSGKAQLAGTCDAPVITPTNTASCVQGAAGDVPGYTLKCSGTYVLHSGSNAPQPPGVYSFERVFGGAWPGSRSGTADIFVVGSKQILSIGPIRPTPGHSIVLSENDTFTQHPLTFSVSTTPGAFNNGKPGNGVICVRTNNPSLTLSSNGLQGANCPLDPNKQYFFNVIPAYYSEAQAKWINPWLPATSAQFGVNYQGQN